MDSSTREQLGQVVRETWVRWAVEQTPPKAEHLDPWEALPERIKEVDRRIGEEVAWQVVGEAVAMWLAYQEHGQSSKDSRERWGRFLDEFAKVVQLFHPNMKLPPAEGRGDDKIAG